MKSKPLWRFQQSIFWNLVKIRITNSAETQIAYVATGEYIGVSAIAAQEKIANSRGTLRTIRIDGMSSISDGDLCLAYKHSYAAEKENFADVFADIIVEMSSLYRKAWY